MENIKVDRIENINIGASELKTVLFEFEMVDETNGYKYRVGIVSTIKGLNFNVLRREKLNVELT